MEHVALIDYSLYIALFLVGTTLLQLLTNKISFPYTVALLIIGLLSQFLVHFFHLPVHLTMSPEFIYFFLLPILLFESAMHINLHQFKIQFKTITFLSTFGLLLSIFSIGFGLALLLKLPFEIALLFGAIISATDPIAVLTLFKTLGAPKRLALVADGESMFNDATGVIAFRLISGFVLAEKAFQSQTLVESINNFLYVFIGSIILGAIMGHAASALVKRIKAERILIAALLSSLALGSFAVAEHFFHLSGVITTVIAGLVFGNLAHGRMKARAVNFIAEYFGYIGFLSLSLVFFFASFNLDLHLFTKEIPILLLVILVVLIARAISVYGSVFLSNTLPGFRNEPDIPLSWQHILNWGGLRGVIPLVLVYSLPDSFVYKEMMLRFTFATLLFTLFVNGLTIKWLLLKLRLHLPRTEEKIISEELALFRTNEKRRKLQSLPKREFDQAVIKSVDKEFEKLEEAYKKNIIKLANSDEFLLSVKLEALAIERETLKKLFEHRRFNEQVLYEFESELDLQQDALEFPDLYKLRVVNKRGEINTKKAFRKKLILFRRFIAQYRILAKVFHIKEKDLILERYTLLRARLFSSYAVLDYLSRLENIFENKPQLVKAVKEVRSIQQEHIDKNLEEVQEIEARHPDYTFEYQQKIISQLISS